MGTDERQQWLAKSPLPVTAKAKIDVTFETISASMGYAAICSMYGVRKSPHFSIEGLSSEAPTTQRRATRATACEKGRDSTANK